MVPEEEINQSKSPIGYSILVLGLYWLLYFVSQMAVFLPQMLEPMFKALQDNPDISQDVLMEKMMTALYYPWYINLLQALIFALIIYLYRRKDIHFFSFKKLPLREALWIVAASVGLVGISTVLEVVIDRIWPSFNTANQMSLEAIFSQSSVITMFISIVILAPIVEEVMFRGVFMKVLFKKYPALGFVICATLFTLVHSPTDFLSFLVYFVMALGLGFIYWRTERIEASIFAHMLNNLLGFIMIVSQ